MVIPKFYKPPKNNPKNGLFPTIEFRVYKQLKDKRKKQQKISRKWVQITALKEFEKEYSDSDNKPSFKVGNKFYIKYSAGLILVSFLVVHQVCCQVLFQVPLPSPLPSLDPSFISSDAPSWLPSIVPSSIPRPVPSLDPSFIPSDAPSLLPSIVPSSIPSSVPSLDPS